MELRRNEKITFRCTELEKDALAEHSEEDMIFIGGSNFVVAEVLE